MTYSETRRQFYLNAAGIRMWYARRPLPGAAPSPAYPQSVEDTVQQEPADSGDHEAGLQPYSRLKEGARAGGQRTVDLQSLMTPAATEPTVSASARPAPAEVPAVLPPVKEHQPEPLVEVPEPASDSASNDFIAAHLGIWSAESYLLLSQWSDEVSQRLQDSLARNLLSALNQADVGDRQMLNWPVFRNPHVPGNSLADFREVLSGLLSSDQNKSIILLGVLSVASEEQRQFCLKPVLSRVGVDFPYSLAELSASPGHKRELWAALKSGYLV